MKKRILGFLLALCLIIGLLPAIALADGAAAAPVTLKIWDKNAQKSTIATVDFEAEAGKVYYATTTDGAISQFTETDPGDGKWNVKLDNTANPAVLTMDNMNLDTCREVGAATVWENGKNTIQGVFTVAGEGSLEIRVKSNSTILMAGQGGLTTKMAGGTTITCDALAGGERALLTAIHNSAVSTNVTYNAIRETVGSLTFKDANIRVQIQHKQTKEEFIKECIYAKGDLVINNSKILAESTFSEARGMRAGGNLIIQNNSDVSLYNRGDRYAIEVGGEFKIDNSTVKIFNFKYNSAAYYINKMPTLVGVSAKYNNKLAKNWDAWNEIADWTALNLAAGTDMTTGHAYYNYIFAGCLHANAGKQTDCSVAVTCPDCNATIAAAKEHTPEADDGDCTTASKCTVCGKEVAAAASAHTGGTATCTAKAVCTVCNKEYGELAAHTGGTATCTAKAVCTVCNEEYGEKAAHTPKEGTYACSEAHPCATCDGNYREAGAHVGGTATCQAKAKCTNCGAEYGELAACAPAADDGDCTTAIKCSVCGKETTAALTHKYTDNADTTCDNAGCAHTRTVESSGNTTDNPQTGDNTPVVLFVALATLAAAAVIFTKKRAII